jgi:hypothetical protein
MECPCGHNFPDELGKYGCPNCNGDSVKVDEDPAEVIEGEIVQVAPAPLADVEQEAKDAVADALAKIDQDARERIDWLVNEMANQGFEPRPPGQAWSGRSRLMVMASQHFSITPQEASDLLDLAVLDLFHGTAEADRRVRRRLLMRRLAMYRDLILQNVKNKNVEEAWAYLEMRDKFDAPIIDPATGLPKLYKRLKREVITTGFDAASMKLLLEIEQIEISLQKLDAEEGQHSADVVGEILERLDAREDDGNGGTATVSIARRVRSSNIQDLSPRSRALVEKAIAQAKGKK